MSVSFDWWSLATGMHVGWICVKHGFPKNAPLLCARHVAVALHIFAFVDRKNTLLYPPVASMTASAEYDSSLPSTMFRATMPRAFPSATTRSSISRRSMNFTAPRPTWRISAEYAPRRSCWPVCPRA